MANRPSKNTNSEPGGFTNDGSTRNCKYKVWLRSSHFEIPTPVMCALPSVRHPLSSGSISNVRLSRAYRVPTSMLFAESILAIHLLVIMFSVGGLLVIPLGARLGWYLVHIAWLRILHLAVMAIIAGQALAGRACMLTVWQAQFAGHRNPQPLIMHWLNSMIYWHLPMWSFAVLYTTVFFYVLGLIVWVPFGSSTKRRAHPMPH